MKKFKVLAGMLLAAIVASGAELERCLYLRSRRRRRNPPVRKSRSTMIWRNEMRLFLFFNCQFSKEVKR